MPRNRGTSRKGKPKKGERAAGMGRSLTKSQQARYRPKPNGSSRGAGMAMAPGIQSIGVQSEFEQKSVLEMDDLTEFLSQATMANRQFESSRERHLVLDSTSRQYRANQPSVSWQDTTNPTPDFTFCELSVPRRPPWNESTQPEELDRAERESFLEWRRAIAQREEELLDQNIRVTPFEKNLQVWRQLWRVMERSNCLVQIVDGRNPLFYLSRDLKRYATEELQKPMVLLVNKSDFLSKKQREEWHLYLEQEGWNHVFFSAHTEQVVLDHEAAQERKRATQVEYDSENDLDNETLQEEGRNQDNQDCIVQENNPYKAHAHQDSVGIDNPLTRQELLDWLHTFAIKHNCQPDPRYDNRIQFGMVGFPNVGKSSVINVLMGSSKHSHGAVRVGVAAQPGKTKHFQTLLLPTHEDMMLCDCPGLVFPSFVSSTADLIAAGVYPIAQMRDHWPVVQLICQRIPREVLNAHYGIVLPTPSLQDLKERGLVNPEEDATSNAVLPPPTAEELLGTYCIARSMLAAASGVPDYQRAARVVIRDYAEGKLLYCHAPPSQASQEEYHRETLLTSLSRTRKLRAKLTPLLMEQQHQQGQNDCNKHGRETNGESTTADDFDLDGIEDDLDLLDVVGGFANDEGTKKENGGKRGKKHKTMHKHGKKGRKDRNKDPYGCHSDNPNDMLMDGAAGSHAGVVVNAGKYGRRGYTRSNYAGARGAVQYGSLESNKLR